MALKKNTNTSENQCYKALDKAQDTRLEDKDKHKKRNLFQIRKRTENFWNLRPTFSGVKSLLRTIKNAFIKCKLEKELRKLKFHSAPCGTIWGQVKGAPTSFPPFYNIL